MSTSVRVRPVKAAVLTLCALALALPATLAAVDCDRGGCGRIACGSPALPVPPLFWGDLQPVDTTFTLCTKNGPVGCRDSTNFDEFREFYNSFPWFMSLDIENGFILMALAHGLQVLDTHPDPKHPTLLGRIASSALPVQQDSAEIKWPLRDVDAPPGVDTYTAVAGEGGIGLVVLNLSDKGRPTVHYQSFQKNAEQVYAATVGGRHLAFLAANGGGAGGGLYAYDLDKARTFARCSEGAPAAGFGVACPGVLLGKIGNRNPVNFVDGVDEFVVLSAGAGRGFEIWNVTDPAAEQLELTGLAARAVYGVAMWKQNNSYFLALRTEFFDQSQHRLVHEGQIYDVSCIAGANPCGSLGSPLWKKELDSGTPNLFVTFSRGGSVPFLYFGSDNKCSGGTREWVFDVRNPANPVDLSPTGYWNWYYRGSPTGFNNMMPRVAKFHGAYLYRAALSIFDIHRVTADLPPEASFTGPVLDVYVGDPVPFQDTSTPAATSWDWLFQDATVVPTGTAEPPQP